MVGGENVTLDEVYRLILALQKDVREQAKSSVPLDLYISERDATREDLKEAAKDLEQLRAEIHAERDARVLAEQEKNREASGRRLQWTLIVVGPFLSGIVTLLLSLRLPHGGV